MSATNSGTCDGELSSITVVTSERGPDRQRRARGHPRSVLEAGQAASEAITAAREQTERYRAELDEERVRRGQATDALRELQEHARIHGAASPLPFTFAMPPCPLTAEILKRDATIASWSSAYRTVAEAAARDHADFARVRAELLAVIAERDADLRAADARVAAALATVPQDVADQLEDLRIAASDYPTRLARAEDMRGAAERTVAALQKDIHYYVHQSQKATQRELAARHAELEQKEQNFVLRAQLAHGQPAVTAAPPPIPPAPPHPPTGDIPADDPISTPAYEAPLFAPEGEIDPWDQPTPQSPTDHLSRSSSATSHASRPRRRFSVSPAPSERSRGSRQRT